MNRSILVLATVLGLLCASAAAGPLSSAGARNKWGVVTVTASPPTGGTCTGSGEYRIGSTITIKAFPTTGWRFTNWDDSDTNATRLITVRAPVTLRLAYFAQLPPPPPPPTNYSTVTVGWNPANEAFVYRVYQGPAPGTYTNRTVTSATMAVIPIGAGINYIAATTVTIAGLESLYSNEITFTNSP